MIAGPSGPRQPTYGRTALLNPQSIRRALRLTLLACLLFTAAQPAVAHPLGNDSITHFSVLYLFEDRIELDLLLDIAENPSMVFRSAEIDANRDGQDTREEQEAWLNLRAAEYAPLLNCVLDGGHLGFELVPPTKDAASGTSIPSRCIMPIPSTVGMTYRLLIRYVARPGGPLAHGEHTLEYTDKTYMQFPGLKRILLQPTWVLSLDRAAATGLVAGPVPQGLAQAMAGKGFPPEPQPGAMPGDEIRLSLGEAPGEWTLHIQGRVFSLVQEAEGLNLYARTRIQVLEPHPPFWLEDNDPTRYDQYDPMKLADERTASFRFRLHPPPGLPTASAPNSAPAAGPSRLGPLYADGFLNPKSNPSLSPTYEDQAQRLVNALKGGWSWWMFLTITALSFGWGAAHALMPGHAKTVVAAYLISQHGTHWHAALLAVIVTITHTALVVILGLVIYFYRATHPMLGPQLQLWLGILAGVLVAAMGLSLIWRACRGGIGHHHEHGHYHHNDEPRSWWRRLFTHSHPELPGDEQAHGRGHEHLHEHAHPHEHAHGHAGPHEHHHPHDGAHDHQHGQEHDHDHAHQHPHQPGHEHDHGDHHTHEHGGRLHPHPAARAEAGQLTTRMLLVLGITGGIVPCPTATIIMLLGIGADVVPGALYAIGVFSLGLALTLMAVGSLALSSRRFAARVMSDAKHEGELSGPGRRILLQVLPACSGLVVVALGSAIAAHYIHLLQTGRGLFTWIG